MSVFLSLVLCSGPSQSSSHDLSLLYEDIFVFIFISVQTLVWNMGDKKLKKKKKKWERLYARILFFFFGRCETPFSLWEIKSRITLDKAEIAEPHFPSKAVWSGPRLCATSQGGLVAVAGSVFGFSHLERREPPPSSTGRSQTGRWSEQVMSIFFFFQSEVVTEANPVGFPGNENGKKSNLCECLRIVMMVFWTHFFLDGGLVNRPSASHRWACQVMTASFTARYDEKKTKHYQYLDNARSDYFLSRPPSY